MVSACQHRRPCIPFRRDGMKTVSFECCSLARLGRVWNKVSGPGIALKGRGINEGNDDAECEPT